MDRRQPAGVTEELAASYEACRALHRAHGRTYYLATRLLPRWKRPHVHALYGFTRYTDEIVDELNGDTIEQRAVRLRDWSARFWIAASGVVPAASEADLAGSGADLAGSGADPAGSVLPAVRHTIEQFGLDTADFAAFLHSMQMDLSVTRYETYDDLLEYMAGSAAAIGTMMLPILVADRRTNGQPPQPRTLLAARQPARELGLAFQLTNFIRDIGEDLARGRIYLPLKDLADFGVHPTDLSAGIATTPIRSLVAFEVERAQRHYARAAEGVLMLPPSSQRCIRAAYRLYGGILDEVVRARYDVFRERATVPQSRRLAVAASSLLTPAGRPLRIPGA
jgi:phytoene synthase